MRNFVVLALALCSGCAMPDPRATLKIEREQCFQAKHNPLLDPSGDSICEDVRQHDIRAYGRPSMCDFRHC